MHQVEIMLVIYMCLSNRNKFKIHVLLQFQVELSYTLIFVDNFYHAFVEIFVELQYHAIIISSMFSKGKFCLLSVISFTVHCLLYDVIV